MTVEVLVATMNQLDHSLLEKMNISTKVIVGNQCDRNEVEEFEYKGHTCKWLSFNERGVGLNRNNALMRATGDIVLFADDDVVYEDDYETKIQDFYKTHPQADIVIFNFKVSRFEQPAELAVAKTERINKTKARKYGTFCISAKNASLRKANIYFHLEFGGGAKYSCGEDTIFLQDCARAKLKMYTCRDVVGVVHHKESTWFFGHNDKYFYDKGVLYYYINKKWAGIYAFYHCWKHRKEYQQYGWQKAYKIMRKGIKEAK